MLAFANAKINLGLHIIGKRPDGYHNLETVFYPVGLKDVVEIIDAAHTSCVIKGIDVPGEVLDNICVKAYHLLKKDFALPEQQIVLLKSIPIGAGLGGGSSDAAFLIKLVNDKFKLGLSISAMEGYARQLGADCAFFIKNRPVLALGKGDEFKPLDVDLSEYFVVLVKPPIHISTAEAYKGVQPVFPRSKLEDLIKFPVSNWKSVIVNDFERSVCSKYPKIEEIKTQLYHAGATFASMSGSGSCVYALFEQPLSLPELEKSNQVFYNV